MQNITYTLTWSDPNLKSSFTVAPGTLNTNTTSLALFGQGLTPYGQYLLTDLLAMLEHFCNTLPPVNPTFGQLWFNPSNHKVKVYDVTNAWIPVSGIADSQPTNPYTGELWFNTANNTLNYWDTTAWQVIVDEVTLTSAITTLSNTLTSSITTETQARIAADTLLTNTKVDRAGDTMTGPLVVNDQISAQNQYGDYIQLGGTTTQAGYAFTLLNSARPLYIWSPTGNVNIIVDGTLNVTSLTINDAPVNPTDGTNMSYVDTLNSQTLASIQSTLNSEYLQLSGGILTGPLTLPGLPTQPLQAAPKSYVDTSLTSFAGGKVYTGSVSIAMTVTSGGYNTVANDSTFEFLPTTMDIDLTTWYNQYVSEFGQIPTQEFVVLAIPALTSVNVHVTQYYPGVGTYDCSIVGYWNGSGYGITSGNEVIQNAINSAAGGTTNTAIVPFKMQLQIGATNFGHYYSTSGVGGAGRITFIAGHINSVMSALPLAWTATSIS